jgi:hypothetical protein
MKKLVLAASLLAAFVTLSGCTDLGLNSPAMKTTEAQALPPYHVTQSFSAQQ